MNLDNKQVERSVGDELTILPKKLQKALKTAVNMSRIDSGQILQTAVGKLWVPLTVYVTSRTVCLMVDCLTPQQHASVSQGRICSDHLVCAATLR